MLSLSSLALARAQLSVASLIADEHFRRAEPLVAAELAKQPSDVSALVALSTTAWAYGDFEKAQSAAEKAVAASDSSAAAHAQLVNILGARLASKKTGTMEKMGLSRRFRREAERTLQLDAKNVYAYEALARYSWYAPALSGGDKSKAMQFVAQVIAIDSTRGYALKAELDATQDKAKALQDWKEAVAAQPSSYEAHCGLGNALFAAGGDGWKGAETEARKAVSIEASRVAAYRLLATVYAGTQQWAKLEAVISEARAVVQDDASPEFSAAEVILDRNFPPQLARAEEYLRQYLSTPVEGLEPSAAMAHWQLGLVLEKEGRRSTALEEVQTAASLDPSLDGAKRDIKRLQ